jgi:hypothetical protein
MGHQGSEWEPVTTKSHQEADNANHALMQKTKMRFDWGFGKSGEKASKAKGRSSHPFGTGSHRNPQRLITFFRTVDIVSSLA